MEIFLIINEGATHPVSTGWAQLGTRRIGRCGGGPEAARWCPFRSGIYSEITEKTVLNMTAIKAGFGPIYVAQPDLISSVNIVSIILLIVHPYFCSLSDT